MKYPLNSVEERINANPKGFFEDAKQDTLERKTSDIVTCFLSQFTSEIHHNQDGDELELSPDTFLPYGCTYHEASISRSGWDEETYRHIITTCMQELLEKNNGELELPSGQRILKQGSKYVVVPSN